MLNPAAGGFLDAAARSMESAFWFQLHSGQGRARAQAFDSLEVAGVFLSLGSCGMCRSLAS